MDAREERGRHIAATCKLTHKGGVWSVPSQNQDGKRYAVVAHPDAPSCSCPDFEEREMTCKHIYPVLFTLKRQHHRDGTTT